MMVRPAAVLAIGALTACATMGGAGGSQRSCEPVAGALPASTSLAPMQGRFILTMVATAGPRTGQSIGGYLTLRQAPAGTPAPAAGARTALIGTTDIGLEVVGALRIGDTGSDDPRAPGVAVYEQRPASGGPTVTARIGSGSTAVSSSGLREIEADHMALFIRRIGTDGFAGGWSSAPGGMTGREARGHFCAVRVTD